jgi:hypothetical protein
MIAGKNGMSDFSRIDGRAAMPKPVCENLSAESAEFKDFFKG